MAHRWRTNPEWELVWHSWDDDETVVFHSGSGDTHILNPIAAAALHALAANALSVEELAETIASHEGMLADGELVQNMQWLLHEFDELGLIERTR